MTSTVASFIVIASLTPADAVQDRLYVGVPNHFCRPYPPSPRRKRSRSSSISRPDQFLPSSPMNLLGVRRASQELSDQQEHQLKTPLNPRYAPSISKAISLLPPSSTSSCAFIPFNLINHAIIFPRPSKSRSVTAFTLWISSASKGCRASLDAIPSFSASRKVMKFSVARRTCELEGAAPDGLVEGGGC